MASSVDICNMALGHLGAKSEVVSINPPDGSVGADYCARYFGHAVSLALEREDWGFARKRVALGQITNPTTVWAYAYALPSDCIKARKILTDSPANYEQDTEPFIVEGGSIYTNKADAVLLYTWQVDNVARFTPGFVLAVSYELAALLAGPVLRGNEGVNAAIKLRQAAAVAAAHAAAVASDELPTDYYVPGALAARGSLVRG